MLPRRQRCRWLLRDRAPGAPGALGTPPLADTVAREPCRRTEEAGGTRHLRRVTAVLHEQEPVCVTVKDRRRDGGPTRWLVLRAGVEDQAHGIAVRQVAAPQRRADPRQAALAVLLGARAAARQQPHRAQRSRAAE